MITVDASIVASWFLDDEQMPLDVQEAIVEGESAFAPANMPYEVAQALISAERQRRFKPERYARVAEVLQRLNIQLRHAPFAHVVEISKKHSISAYDAAYVAVAIETGAPLATNDAGQSAAAKREKVLWAPPRRRR